MNHSAVTQKSLLQYGFIAIPIAFAGFPLYVLAPDFYATQHGLSLALLGMLLLGIRLLDAVQDPVIGWLADKLHGKFLPLITIAGLVLCLAIFGLFNIMAIDPVIWFTLCMISAVSAYSVLSITIGTQATLWTDNQNDQTRIAGAREAFGLIGLVTAVSMPSILGNFVSADQVYIWYSLFLALLMVVAVYIFSKILAPAPKQPDRKISFFSGLRALPRESRQLFVAYGISMLASSIPAVLVIFFIRDLLNAENLTGMFLLLYFLSGAAVMPIWKNISIRFGKARAWVISNILSVAGFIGAYFLGAGDVWAYGMVCIISGFALGADLALPPSMLADQIHARGNRNFSGTHYAMLAFVTKASLAIASSIALPMLDAAGFRPQADNSSDALHILSVAYALVPCVLKLIAAAMLYIFFIRPQSGGNHEIFQTHPNHRSSDHV